jgi:hypothetical protein
MKSETSTATIDVGVIMNVALLPALVIVVRIRNSIRGSTVQECGVVPYSDLEKVMFFT